jgi:hypothetical protein
MPSWKKLISSGSSAVLSSLTLDSPLAVAQGGTGVTSSTGTTNVVLSNSPTLVTPALGTPSALVLTNATALPAAQVAQGTMASGMVLVAPALGTPASGNLANCTFPTLNQNTTGQAATVATITGLAPDTATTQATQASITSAANLATVGTIGTGVWNGDVIASAYLDSDTAHLTTDQTFSGKKTFSQAITGSHYSGSATSTGSFAQLRLNVSSLSNSGSEVVTVDGTLGRLFSVTDEMSGSIFSANTIAGLPVIEAFSDYKVTLGPFSSPMEIDSSGNISASADIVAEGDVIAYYTSDIRLKDNLQVIKGSLDKIGKINGYEFDWNDKSPGWARERGHDVGVIAQEVQKVLPEVVVERKSGYLGVDYKRLIPLLVESIKELKQEVENLKKKVN